MSIYQYPQDVYRSSHFCQSGTMRPAIRLTARNKIYENSVFMKISICTKLRLPQTAPVTWRAAASQIAST